MTATSHPAAAASASRAASSAVCMPYHLEFTQHDHGSPGPAPSRDNLLVLYFDGPAQAERAAARLAALGHPRVEAENPYWTESGAVTVEDPDHWRVVLMPRPFTSVDEPPATIEWYTGDRDALRPLFELAEDSAAELDSYLHSGRVLIARSGPRIVGHLSPASMPGGGKTSVRRSNRAPIRRGARRTVAEEAMTLGRTMTGADGTAGGCNTEPFGMISHVASRSTAA
jgi:hypothetical protein